MILSISLASQNLSHFKRQAPIKSYFSGNFINCDFVRPRGDSNQSLSSAVYTMPQVSQQYLDGGVNEGMAKLKGREWRVC